MDDDYDFDDIVLNIQTPEYPPKNVSSKPQGWKDKQNKVQDREERHERSFIKQIRQNRHERSFKKQTEQNRHERSIENKTHDDYEEQEDTTNVNKLEKSGGFVSSLFNKNPQIPSFASRAVIPRSEAVFSSGQFKELPLHPFTISNLDQNLGLQKLTTVQQKAIPVILSGSDALVRSQTGSGKTLAYAVPIIEKLQSIRPKIARSNGIQAVVVVPTRELALQTYEWFVKLVKPFTWIVPGYLTGGEKRKSEKARLRKGITVLIGTPGRLLDHIQHTKTLRLDYVKWLILDEADMLLDMGYEKDVASFVETLKSHTNDSPYQTVLLSAILSTAVERLAGLTLRSPTFVDAADEVVEDELVIPKSLRQYYLLTPTKLRLVTLSAVVQSKCQNSKMLIFFATQDMVDFHTNLFSYGLSGIQLFRLHGNMTKSERVEMFKTFRASDAGVLLCTDVAARGLDMPRVNCIVQYTGPPTPGDYVHRVGRTARVGNKGDAILFLTPSEVQFLRQLEDRRICLREQKMDQYLQKLQEASSYSTVEEAAGALQTRYEEAVINEPSLHELASKAFVSWSRSYAGYPKATKKVFNFNECHLGHYAKSFALRDPPSKIGGIGCQVQLQTQRWRYQQNVGEKRSRPGSSTVRQTDMSEFSSGLQPILKKIKKKK